jgi:hypothetical protein
MIGQRGRQMIEQVSGTRRLRRYITAVVGIDRPAISVRAFVKP